MAARGVLLVPLPRLCPLHLTASIVRTVTMPVRPRGEVAATKRPPVLVAGESLRSIGCEDIV